MSESAAKIANYFLELGDKEGIPMTTLKLVKLIYIAHGWCLAILDRDILNNESVEAWQHGPVIPSLYHEFKSFGKNSIRSRATEIEFLAPDDDLDTFSIEQVTPTLNNGDEDLISVLNFVWDVYKQYSAFDLVNITHEKDSPWSKHYKHGERNTIIDNDTIKQFYENQVTHFLKKNK